MIGKALPEGDLGGGRREADSALGAPDGASSYGLDDRLTILQEINLALNSTLDPDRLIEVILDSSIRYTGATTGSLMLVDGENLRIVASRGLGTNVREEVVLRVGEGVTGVVASEGRPINVPDVRGEPRYVMVKEHIRSELAAPLSLDKKVMGVISVDSTRVANFSDDDLQLLTLVGTQAAQILENARAFNDLRRKARRDETLFEVGQALGSALNIEELFQKVTGSLSSRNGMSQGFLVLGEPSSDELHIELAYGMTAAEIAKGRYQKGEGIIGGVFRTGNPVGVKDVRQEPQFLGRTGAFHAVDEPMSFYAIPIFLENDVVGVFGAGKRYNGEDTEMEEDLALLQIVAGTFSQAVRIHRGVAQEKAKLLEENRLLREELGTRYRFDNLVGASPAMQAVYSIISNVAPTRSTVLIRGESGTGKELIAHAIHSNSPRGDKPFIRVNCAAIPEPLLEAELFGHVKGSFTGAIADRKGKFQLADTGTIFLDEIGDMSPVLQAKILRVLQERELEVVGSEGTIRVDVRVLAATHQNLESLIEQGTFREDLYYRLNVVPIVVPPLRERLEDVRVLAEHFLARLIEENQLAETTFSAEALRALMRFSWPGNVRQLENVIERGVVLCEDGLIQPEHLPELASPSSSPRAATQEGPASLAGAVEWYLDGRFGPPPAAGGLWDGTLREVEQVLIRRAMAASSGVQLQAAELLGIHRNTLRKKLADVPVHKE